MDATLVATLVDQLELQKNQYSKYEVEALNGPDPTQTKFTVGAREAVAIRSQARGSHGARILEARLNALGIIGVTTLAGDPAPCFDDWKQQRIDTKFRQIARDAYVGGVGYLVLVKPVGADKVQRTVVSPKSIITVSTDPVNNEYPDFALQVINSTFNGETSTYYKVWDATFIYMFTRGQKAGNYDLVGEPTPHGFTACPVVPFYDIIYSDGSVYSTIELLSPALENLRQKNVAISEVAYWNGQKLLVLNGVDLNETRIDETGNVQYIYQDILREFSTSSNGVHILPVTDSGEHIDFTQTTEGNLLQLIATEKAQRETLAALSSTPLSLLDGSVQPMNSEGATQEYAPFRTTIKRDQEKFGAALLSAQRLVDAAEGNEVDYDLAVMWKPIDEASLNVIADTVSKLTASGVPIEWVVRYVMDGFTSEAKTELLEQIKESNLLPRGVETIPKQPMVETPTQGLAPDGLTEG